MVPHLSYKSIFYTYEKLISETDVKLIFYVLYDVYVNRLSSSSFIIVPVFFVDVLDLVQY